MPKSISSRVNLHVLHLMRFWHKIQPIFPHIGLTDDQIHDSNFQHLLHPSVQEYHRMDKLLHNPPDWKPSLLRLLLHCHIHKHVINTHFLPVECLTDLLSVKLSVHPSENRISRIISPVHFPCNRRLFNPRRHLNLAGHSRCTVRKHI